LCLCPPVLQRLLDRALIIIRQPPLEQRPSWRGMGAAVAWTVVGWLLLGMQAWLLLADVVRTDPRVMSLALGAFAFACSAALLLVIFPNGIGAREVLFVAAVAPVVPHGPALAVALVARVVTTASDLAWGGVGLLIGRSRRRVGKHRKPARPAVSQARSGSTVPETAGSSATLADGPAAISG
jgi:glycosyltransferase 2 family protein